MMQSRIRTSLRKPRTKNLAFESISAWMDAFPHKNMKMFHPKRCLVPMLSLGLLCGMGMAEDTVPDHKLSEWDFGKVLFGEKFFNKDLKGKVVLIENWGVRCPPCIAAMPHLADLDKKYREDGLVIIGAECQGSSKEDIETIVKNAKVEFTITERANGPIEFSGIPRCHLFGRDGKLIYDGFPQEDKLKSAIRKALKEAGAEPAKEPEDPDKPLVASRTWTNSDGKSIIAAVKSADDTKVVFIMPNGKEVTYPLEKLSESSRNDLKEATKPIENTEDEDL
jgi:thiol-disulfide isomerase/thioredoxin